MIHTADSGLNLRISALVDASSTLRTLVDQAGRAGLRIHVMPEGALPDDASAVLTIVGVNSGPTDVVVRLDVSAADARLAETLEHEIGHALAGTARSASGSEAPIAEGLSQLGLLAVRP